MDEDAALKSFRLGSLSCASEYLGVKKKQGWIPGRESGPFVVLGLAVRSWCCPRELAQAGGLIAHGGQGLLPCWGKVRFHGERGGTLVMVCHCPL